MVDQHDAEMDSGDDDNGWGELKRLGGEAHTKKDYALAAELYSQSIDALDGLMERQPALRTAGHTKDKAKLHANRAASLMMLMRLSEAQRECKASIGIDPSYTRAYLRLGRILVMLGDIVEAKHNLSIAKGQVSERPSDTSPEDRASIKKLQVTIDKLSALQSKIKWFTDIGDLRQALTHTETALVLAPNCRMLQVQKARLLLDQKYVAVCRDQFGYLSNSRRACGLRCTPE
jgi:DnaJ family protein C protein 7